MKKHFLSLAALILTATAFGQVENDDMYFNSKDRAQLKAQKISEESSYVMATAKKTKKTEQAAAEEVINPTDSYSARNVNPEFAARSNSQTAAADNQDYFVNNYQYTTASNLNNWNSNFNSYYNNSAWYNNNYYNPGMYSMYGVTGMNSPFYGNYYGGYYDPWGSPYYQTPYSSMWNYGWNSGIGFGMSYGFGSPYYSSYYGNPYGGYYGGGYGYYGGGYGYPGNIVVVNNHYYGDNGRNVVYGKRATHGAMITAPQDAAYTRSRTSYVPTTRPDVTGGRVATTTSQRQDDYYNRSWRNSQQSSYSNPSRNSSSDSWNNTSNRSGSDSFYRHDSGSSYSPSRSSSSFDSGGGGGGSRSSAPASSGSNGRTRGRD
jgi:hypothetical protein